MKIYIRLNNLKIRHAPCYCALQSYGLLFELPVFIAGLKNKNSYRCKKYSLGSINGHGYILYGSSTAKLLH